MLSDLRDRKGEFHHRMHLWTQAIFFSFRRPRYLGDCTTWRPHKAKDSWAPDQTGTGTIAEVEAATVLGHRRK